MKKISTLLLNTLFSFAVFAKYDDPHLSISSFSTVKELQVEVDGKRYYFDKDNSITIRNLRSGYHTVKVTRERKRSSSRLFDINIGKRRDVMYSSSIYLRTGYDFDITINKFGKVFTDEARIDRDNEWNDDDRDRDYDRDRDRDRDKDQDRDKDRDRDRDDDRNRDRDYDNNYSRAMSAYDFNQAKETLRREIFENSRVTMAKQISDRNYFTSQQVKEVLSLFTFENNKLDIAKYAYRNTVDKNNYHVVNDAFTFSSSKDELARYIRDFR